MTFTPHIHSGDERPIYRQLTQQVLDAVARGGLRAGERMPSHRQLAEQLVVAPLTIKKAYDELERQGILRTQRGQGTFVVENLPTRPSGEGHERLAATVRRLLAESHALGASLDEVVEMVRNEDARLRAERAHNEEQA